MATDNQYLNCILAELQKLNENLTFGNNFLRITPYTLGTSSQRILTREEQNRLRKVSIWVDAASGGPTPTIRIGTSDVGSGAQGGGIRVNAGASNSIGEVPANSELWAAASTAINIYVVEVG